MRWQRQPGHYEVWYLTLNHLASETGFWIRYTLEAPVVGHGEACAQLWFAYFDAREPVRGFALHRRLPIAALQSTDAPFELRVGDAVLRHDHARGKIAGDGHEAEWDLAWLPPAEAHHHLPAWIYTSELADTKVLSPALQAAFRGRIVVDGRTIELNNQPGCQSHLWGRKHAFAWAWSHCSGFAGHPKAALETLTVRLKRGPITLPSLSLLSLYLGDRAHHFRSIAQAPLVRGRAESASYRVCARGRDVKIEVDLACRPEDLVLTPYVDPDGQGLYCHNTEIADCRVTVWRRRGVRFEPELELRAPRAGHFEYGGRELDPAVMRRHKAVA
jgi:hypothetical protein